MMTPLVSNSLWRALVYGLAFWLSYLLLLALAPVQPINPLYFQFALGLILFGAGHVALEQTQRLQPGGDFLREHIVAGLVNVLGLVLLTPWMGLPGLGLSVLFYGSFHGLLLAALYLVAGPVSLPKRLMAFSGGFLGLMLIVGGVLFSPPLQRGLLYVPAQLLNGDFRALDARATRGELTLLDRMRIGWYLGSVPAVLRVADEAAGARLFEAYLNGYLPDARRTLAAFRKQLLRNGGFQAVLQEEQRRAIAHFRRTGEARYHSRQTLVVDMRQLGFGGKNDDWQFDFVTTIRQGRAYTSFLTQPGMIDRQQARAFGGHPEIQLLGQRIIVPVGMFMNALEAFPLGRRYVYAISDAPETSGCFREPLALDSWIEASERLHARHALQASSAR